MGNNFGFTPVIPPSKGLTPEQSKFNLWKEIKYSECWHPKISHEFEPAHGFSQLHSQTASQVNGFGSPKALQFSSRVHSQ